MQQSFEVNFRELPVFLDLIKLPPRVLWKRLRARFFDGKATAELQQDYVSAQNLNLSFYKVEKPPRPELKKMQFLLQKYQERQFNYLGSGWASMLNQDPPAGFEGFRYGQFPRQDLDADEIDWNRDQRTGFQFSRNVSPGDCLSEAFEKEGVDVKFAWEFARMHHLPQLGVWAHFSEGFLEKSTRIFKRDLNTFKQQCPYESGVHWSSPMEVGIRCVNLLVGWNLLKNSGGKVEDLTVAKLAFEHLHFVKNHLERKDGFGTNHYLANLMALIVGGFYLSENEVVRDWKNFALQEFEKEIDKQFFNDGGNFEYSTYYHRLSTEIALISYAFGKKSGYKFQPKTEQTLAKATEFCRNIMKPNGRLPIFGDNDSGRILDLNPSGEWSSENFQPQPENSHFLGEIFQEQTIYHWFYSQFLKNEISNLIEKESSKPLDKNLNSLNMPKHYSSWEIDFDKVDVQKIEQYFYNETGLIVYKSNQFYLAVNLMANSSGHRYRGHSHNDKGSFELTVNGKELIQDAGTYTYTASTNLRNKYRNTEAHNVPFTGIEQNRFLAGFLGLFHLKLETKCSVLLTRKTELLCKIEYQNIVHFRRFKIFDSKLTVEDWCNRPFTINKSQNPPIALGYGKLQ